MPEIESAGDFLTGGPGEGTGGGAFKPDTDDSQFKGKNDNDFSFLDRNNVTEPDPREPISGETLEEYDARIEKLKEEAEAAQTPEAKAKADANKNPDQKPADDKKPDAEEWTPDKIAAEKAKAWDSFNTTLEKKPEELAKFVLSKMTAAEQRALLQEVAPSLLDKDAPKAVDWDDPDYDPVSKIEGALKDRWSHIERLPDIAKQVEALQKQLGESGEATMRRLDVPVTQANIRVELALAKLEAVAEAFDIDLPDPDINAIIELLKDGRKTFRSAVREAVGSSYKDSIANHKQKNVERPKTPGNGSKHSDEIPEGADLATIIRMSRTG